MNRNLYLANRLKEVLLYGTWIANTNFKSQITSIDYKIATQKVDSLNTIALLTFHINYYLKGLLNVLKGGALDIKDKYSFDMSPILSEQDWQNLIEEFLTNASDFVIHVQNMSDFMLDRVFVDPQYGTYLRNIEGVIEHSYYHLGQVSILKKMILKTVH